LIQKWRLEELSLHTTLDDGVENALGDLIRVQLHQIVSDIVIELTI